MSKRRRRRPQEPPAEPDEPFVCTHCRREVQPEPYGTSHRNHCPHCLWSLHVDVEPGDRCSTCRGPMEPVAVWVKPNGEWALVHRCRDCGHLQANRIAGDDNELALMSLAVRPLAEPPFPLDDVTLTHTDERNAPGKPGTDE